MVQSFDNITDALDLIDKLAKKRTHAHLSHTLIEGLYDRWDRLAEALYEWHVEYTEGK